MGVSGEVPSEMMLALYRAFMYLARPLARPLIEARRRRGREAGDPKRRLERLGVPGAPRPSGKIFWFDAVSVGEGNSVVPIMDYILESYPGSHVLVTTTTVTGARNIVSKMSGRVIHQFLPIDRRAWAERFLAHWRPSVGFFADSNFWPNMLLAARAGNIPLILLNGRISERSYARWMRHRRDAKLLMSSFVYALACSGSDAKKLSDMGITGAECVGNLKHGAPPLAYDGGRLNELSRASGNRPSWVASVTHPGEEEIILGAHASVRRVVPDAMLIVIPRDPDRGSEVLDMARRAGFLSALESAGDQVTESTGVYVSDVLGGLGLYYAFSGLVFVGCSLLETMDGHNPMEAARLGAAILSGRNVASFQETYDMLKREDAVIMTGKDDLAEKVAGLLSDKDKLEALRSRALEIAKNEAGVIDRTKEKLRERLEKILT
ncbi:MAG: hypothetical protein LBR87_09395 [Synergistaceae bacterium]|jgi:3-deoxy-D-manno-octulosonic-acid transferase|nr:hypothetical protein [Synergistaceae bacterium]